MFDIELCQQQLIRLVLSRCRFFPFNDTPHLANHRAPWLSTFIGLYPLPQSSSQEPFPGFTILIKSAVGNFSGGDVGNWSVGFGEPCGEKGTRV